MAVIVKGNQYTGPRARIEYKGQVIAWANNITFGHGQQTEAQRVIGSIEKVEDVVVGYEPNFSAGQFYLVNQSVATLQMSAPLGQDPDQHLLNILELGEAEAVLMDRVADIMIGLIEGLKCVNAAHAIGVQALVTTDTQWVCRRIYYLGG